MERPIAISKVFADIFGKEPTVVRSPLPIRLLGEHGSFNDGWLLTTTVNKWVRVAVSKREDPGIQLFSVQHLEKIEVPPTELIELPVTSWARPVFAVICSFHKKGHIIQGLNIMIDTGEAIAAMNPAIALESALYFALKELFSLQLSTQDLISFARVEFDPDFYTCFFGRAGYALQLDARNQSHEYIPMRFGDCTLVLFTTANGPCIPNELYRKRKEECLVVIKQLHKTNPAIRTLRDISLPLLYSHIYDAAMRMHTAFIIRENARVVAASVNLKVGNIKSFGQKLYESADGLMTEYEMNCREADWIIDELGWSEQVVGARAMTSVSGNGVISVIRTAELDKMTISVGEAFEKYWGKKLTTRPLITTQGTELVKDTLNQSELQGRYTL